MAVSPQEELISSLQQLYRDPEFSDLNIVSTVKTYPVHKAIVCPRSPHIAKKCREIASNGCHESSKPSILVKDADPTAVDLVVEYLYNLNYSDPSDSSIQPYDNSDELNGGSGGVNDKGHPLEPDSPVNGTTNGARPSNPDETGYDQSSETMSSQKTEYAGSAIDPVDDFLQIPPLKKTKRKKRKTVNGTSAEAPRPGTLEATAEQGESLPDPSAEAGADYHGNMVNNTDTQDGKSAMPLETQVVVPRKLTTHAKVYALSSHFGIVGLQALALDKFETQAQSEWDAEDFLAAAKEVYSIDEQKDQTQSLKEVVLSTMVRHQELLDHEEMEKIASLRPKLAYDLLKRVRRSGGFL